VRKMSVAVLVDQDLTWEREKNGYRRVLVAPPPEKLKVIHDLVAGVTGSSAERGDQVVVESLPFETTLALEPPALPPTPGPSGQPGSLPGLALKWNRQMQIIAGAAGLVVVALGVGIPILLKRGRKNQAAGGVSIPPALTGGESAASTQSALEGGGSIEQKIESQLAERDALQQQAEAKALESLKLTPVITKQAEVLAKHLREKISKDPEIAAQVLRTWIRGEEESS
jgi:flagellar M-ring protein FliF